ncbi:hypothetical protein [Cupriavidus nantongensis]|uniref:hypothetical protein n=1 Tax=Cupriavidus nantongensis TaxID=1796606 RepID=UPI00358E5859
MTRKRYVVASLGALALAGIVAACGSGNDESGSAPSSPAPVADAPVSVKIIGLNDFHGNLEAPAAAWWYRMPPARLARGFRRAVPHTWPR